jgi:hypothetical protein
VSPDLCTSSTCSKEASGVRAIRLKVAVLQLREFGRDRDLGSDSYDPTRSSDVISAECRRETCQQGGRAARLEVELVVARGPAWFALAYEGP